MNKKTAKIVRGERVIISIIDFEGEEDNTSKFKGRSFIASPTARKTTPRSSKEDPLSPHRRRGRQHLEVQRKILYRLSDGEEDNTSKFKGRSFIASPTAMYFQSMKKKTAKMVRGKQTTISVVDKLDMTMLDELPSIGRSSCCVGCLPVVCNSPQFRHCGLKPGGHPSFTQSSEEDPLSPLRW
ncbi:hypothetical protein MMC07_006504 [Pseudocyphellaria aurata]|nr:hypothetical protein [Pseudocyphellaria aurata]